MHKLFDGMMAFKIFEWPESRKWGKLCLFISVFSSMSICLLNYLNISIIHLYDACVMRSINAFCAYFHTQIHFWTLNYLNFYLFCKHHNAETTLHSCIEYIIFFSVFLIIFVSPSLNWKLNWYEIHISTCILNSFECIRAAFPLSHTIILFYCHWTNVKQIGMCKSLIPVSGFSKMANNIFILFQMEFHTSRTNWFMCYNISKNLCSHLVRVTKLTSAFETTWLVVHKRTNKQAEICLQTFVWTEKLFTFRIFRERVSEGESKECRTN